MRKNLLLKSALLNVVFVILGCSGDDSATPEIGEHGSNGGTNSVQSSVHTGGNGTNPPSTTSVSGGDAATGGAATGGSASSSTTKATGGTRASGGAGAGGIVTGGTKASGGAASGGTRASGGTKASGGAGSGGRASGGAATATGGKASGGAATATGGKATGGAATATGGKATGGGATGGSATGGKATGGSPATGGAATGGAATGGSKPTGGSATTGGNTSTSTSNGPDCNAPMPTGGTKHTGNSQGGAGNLAWQLWANNAANGSITTFSSPAFSTSWASAGDFLARLGFEWGNGGKTYDTYGQITAQFSWKKTGDGGGYSYLGIYGWSTNPCIEYYIVDDSFKTMPVNPGNTTNKGTVNIDGGDYIIYLRNTTGTGGNRCGNVTNWNQYYSVRKTARQCGVISVTKHFDAWKAAGLDLGNMLEAKILVEVGGGTGTVDLPVANMTAQ